MGCGLGLVAFIAPPACFCGDESDARRVRPTRFQVASQRALHRRVLLVHGTRYPRVPVRHVIATSGSLERQRPAWPMLSHNVNPHVCIINKPRFCFYCMYNNAKMGVAQPTPGRSTNPGVAQPTPFSAFIVYIITQNWGSIQTTNTKVGIAQPTPFLLFIAFYCIDNNAKVGSLLRAPTPTDKPLFIFYC